MVKLPTPLQERGLAATEEKKALLTHGQVELLFSAVPVSVLANIVGALLAYFVFIDRVSPLRLQVWITLLLTVTAGLSTWYLQFRLGSQILAGVAGSAGFMLFDYDDMILQLVLALMMVCIASFAITTMSPSLELTVTFLLLLLGPITGSLFLSHAVTHSYVEWMLPMTLAVLLLSCIRINRNTERNIILTIEEMQHEKAVRNFQQRLGFFRETPLAVLEWGQRGNVVQWNPADNAGGINPLPAPAGNAVG